MVSKKKRQTTESLAETFARLLPCPEAVSLPIPRFSNVGPRGPFDLSTLPDVTEGGAVPHWNDPTLHDLRVFLQTRPGSSGTEVWAVVSCDQPADHGLAVSIALLAENDRWQRRTVALDIPEPNGSRGEICIGILKHLLDDLADKRVTIDVFLLQPAERPAGSPRAGAPPSETPVAPVVEEAGTAINDEELAPLLKKMSGKDAAAASLALAELIHRVHQPLCQKLMRATEPRDHVYLNDALEAAWVIVWRRGRRGQWRDHFFNHLLTIAGEQLCRVIKYRSSVPAPHPEGGPGRGGQTERSRSLSSQSPGGSRSLSTTADPGADERIANLRRQLPPISEQDRAMLDLTDEGIPWASFSSPPP
jgi:hypothetical protein